MRDVLTPAPKGDREEYERAKVVLHGVWLITLGVVLVGLTRGLESGWGSLSPRLAPLALTVPPLALACVELNRRGRTRAAAWLFVVGYILLASMRAFSSGGIHSPTIAFFPVMTLFAGLTLGGRIGAATGVVCSGLGLVCLVLERRGLIAPLNVSPLVAWVSLCVYVGITLYLMQIALGRSTRALREAQAELKSRVATERRLSLALESAAIGTFERVIGSETLHFDDQGFRVLGFEPTPDGTLKGSEFRKRLDPDNLRKLASALDSAVRDGTDIRLEYEVCDPDGQRRHIDSAAAIHVEPDTGRQIQVGIVRDITRRKLSERAIHDSQQKLNAMFENSPLGIALVGIDGKFISCNPFIQRVLGYSEAELSGMTFMEVTHPDDVDAARSVFQEELFGGQRDRYEIERRYVTRDGRVIWGDLAVAVVRDGDGRPLYAVAMINEITERKQAEIERRALERQLRSTEQMRAIGALAGGIAHDFNNILGAIMGFSRLLEEDLPEGSADHRFATRITDSAERGKAVVEQILSFARGGAQERTVVELSSLSQDLKPLLESLVAKSVTLRIDPGPGRLWARINTGQVTQVLSNLCKNASDAFDGREGHITVQIRRLTAPARAEFFRDVLRGVALITGEIAPETDYVLIRVTDDAGGMTPQVMARIFDPFYTTKERGRGTGLGLAVVQSATQGHGGACVAQSEVGAGSRFSVLLPLTEPPPQAKAISVEAVGSAGGRILLVDDEQDITEVLAAGLTRRGFEVVSFNDPRAALLALEGDAASWRMIITDGMMPELRGSDLARAAKALRPDLPVVLYSGFDDASRAVADEEGLFDMRLPKPMDIDEMTRALATL